MPGNCSNSCNEAVLILIGCAGPVFLGVAEAPDVPELCPVAARGAEDPSSLEVRAVVVRLVASLVEVTDDFFFERDALVDPEVPPKETWFFNPSIFVCVIPLTFLRSSRLS